MSDPSPSSSQSARLEQADEDAEDAGGSGQCQAQEPVQVQLVVRVRDGLAADHPVIQGAYVTVTPTGGGAQQTGNTNAEGRATFQVTPGNYDVTAARDWYVPEPRQALNRNVPADPAQTVVEMEIEPLHFYLHVDADRDGQVDDDRTGIDNWQWGAANKGAVVLCNNDHDDGEPDWRRNPDHDDNVVNQGNDNIEIAPLEIRRHGSALAAPGGWAAELSVPVGSWRQRIRIFSAQAAGSAEVLGPTTGRTWNVPLPAAGAALTCGMEATRYAGALFNGLITLTLKVEKAAHVDGSAGPVRYDSQAQVRVAPWIMPHHGDDAARVYVVDRGGDNQNFRQDLDNHVQAAGCVLDTRNHRNAVPDRWMQDCMEIGYSVLPGNPRPHRIEAVMKAHRDRGLDRIARELLDADVGFHEQGDARPSTTFDSTGNLEVTPPVRDQGGHVYPWGRIYYGNGGGDFNPTVRQFLEAQVVQAPIQLDTDWLQVGHVDEMMSFVPTGGIPLKQWKLLIASPERAYEILDAADDALHLLVGRQLRFGGGWVDVESSVGDFLNHDTRVEDPAPPHGPISGADLRDFNLNTIQPRIDAVVQQLRNDIQLLDHRIVRVPVIFMPENAAWTRAGALTADMVNMLVVNRHCIVPMAYGPEDAVPSDLFEEDLRGELVAAGLTVHFINDWYSYHAGKGEVHCGTNTLRRPQNRNAWLDGAAARWWEYEP